MIPKKKKLELDLDWLKSWFDFAPEERLLLAGILAIALIGLTARYMYLTRQQPEICQPSGLPAHQHGGFHE
jgi:hypothetical protein